MINPNSSKDDEKSALRKCRSAIFFLEAIARQKCDIARNPGDPQSGATANFGKNQQACTDARKQVIDMAEQCLRLTK